MEQIIIISQQIVMGGGNRLKMILMIINLQIEHQNYVALTQVYLLVYMEKDVATKQFLIKDTALRHLQIYNKFLVLMIQIKTSRFIMNINFIYNQTIILN